MFHTQAVSMFMIHLHTNIHA